MLVITKKSDLPLHFLVDEHLPSKKHANNIMPNWIMAIVRSTNHVYLQSIYMMTTHNRVNQQYNKGILIFSVLNV